MQNWFFISLIFSFTACQSTREAPDAGKQLIKQYCTTCHLTPDPKSLTKTIWQDQVLPKMGAYLGMSTSFTELKYLSSLQQVGAAPAQPMLNESEWSKIQDYILSHAPDTLMVSKAYPILKNELEVFRKIDLGLSSPSSTTSLVSFRKGHKSILFGSAKTASLYQLNLSDNRIDSIPVGGAPSALVEKDGYIFLLSMGQIYPNDSKEGSLLKIKSDPLTIEEKILTQLPRPVHFQIVDLDDDLDDDIIVSGFGNILGQLSWHENQGRYFENHILSDLPGAIKTIYQDLNEDGIKDIVALMAQGDEGIYLHAGSYKKDFQPRKSILRFPPNYGSTYFELTDFNDDKKPDILYASGDNGDYKPFMKSYHGIRIFINYSTGNSIKYEESAFIQLNGAFKAMAADYDLDGDLDIAALSHFPDKDKTPEEGLIYFENQGDLTFEAHALPAVPNSRWLVMDAADYDKDGDTDILIGSSSTMSSEGLTKPANHNSTSGVVLLQNVTIP
ncbi:MAG: VCBS repeat-containing protein [Saprospiraceae bacterium]|nr:VCBS repeat-containing protein [Saprospiraceae bacterium]